MHGRLAIGELEHAGTSGERGRQLAGGEREGCDGLERREREKCEHGHEHRIEISGSMGRDGDSQHCCGGRSQDEDPKRVRKPGRERVSPGQPSQRAVERAKPLQRHVLASVHDELGRAAKDLDELCAELSLRCPTSTARPATEQPGNGGNADPSHEQAREKHEGGGREDRNGNADRYRARQHGHGRWAEPAKVEALQSVDVADHAAHEISAAIRLEPSRGKGLDPFEEPNANASEHAKREVVRCEPLEVAGKRPR